MGAFLLLSLDGRGLRACSRTPIRGEGVPLLEHPRQRKKPRPTRDGAFRGATLLYSRRNCACRISYGH